MSSTPPGTSLPPSFSIVTRSKASPLVGLFTLGALAMTGIMMKDAYMGSRDRNQQKIAECHQSKDLEYAQYGWGHWSGQPGMDGLAHKFKGALLYGPYGLAENWHAAKIHVGSFFSDVLYPNLIPLGISIAGIYGTFGPDAVNHKINSLYNQMCRVQMHPELKASLKQFFKRGGRMIGTGLGNIVAWPFKGGLGRLGVSSGLLFAGAFFLKRFNDAYGHDGQRAFFRDEIYNREEHH